MAAESNKSELLLQVEVPGIEPDEMKVEVKDGVLTISGEHHEDRTEEREGYVHHETHYSSFSRSVTLPPDVDAKQLKTHIEDGKVEVLVENGKVEVTLPAAKSDGHRPGSV
ncbi:MAG: Hsp20/alpha crystallin family protein [Solirubrobacterales bacterium]